MNIKNARMCKTDGVSQFVYNSRECFFDFSPYILYTPYKQIQEGGSTFITALTEQRPSTLSQQKKSDPTQKRYINTSRYACKLYEKDDPKPTRLLQTTSTTNVCEKINALQNLFLLSFID